MRLRSQAERDRALCDHVETTHFFDEDSGELYEPTDPPEVPGWGEDGDEHEDDA